MGVWGLSVGVWGVALGRRGGFTARLTFDVRESYLGRGGFFGLYGEIHRFLCACLHVCMCACLHVCVFACVHVCVCVCVCVRACIHPPHHQATQPTPPSTGGER